MCLLALLMRALDYDIPEIEGNDICPMVNQHLITKLMLHLHIEESVKISSCYFTELCDSFEVLVGIYI